MFVRGGSGGQGVRALAEANAGRWWDGKSIWKVLNREASGSVGGIELRFSREAVNIFVCAMMRKQAPRIDCERVSLGC